MIPILLRDMAPRLLLVALLGLMFYTLEPGFHEHGIEAAEVALGEAPQLSFSVANFAGLATIVLLAGFVSRDRREGYYRMFFAHPTNPLFFYGVGWMLALLLALVAGAVFLYVGQWAAWGELRVGPAFLLHAFGFAWMYGGLLAFLSLVLVRGSAVVAVLIFFFTEFFYFITRSLGADPLPPLLRDLLFFVLPPHAVLNELYESILMGAVDGVALIFVLGYGAVWLGLAGLLLRLREWP